MTDKQVMSVVIQLGSSYSYHVKSKNLIDCSALLYMCCHSLYRLLRKSENKPGSSMLMV